MTPATETAFVVSDILTEAFVVAVGAGALRSATPVLLAALGEVVTQRSGVLNLGLEGIMLIGGLASVAVSFHTGSPMLGVLAAFTSGVLFGLLHAFFCLQFAVNQVACGVALMVFGTGFSAFLGIQYVGKAIASVRPTPVPILSDISFLGPIIFSHDVLVYVTFLLVPMIAVVLYRTKIGLYVRAVGENPEAASAAGIRVLQVRYIATAFGGGLAALGGAYLALVYAQGWVDNLTAGRGLIAVGLVIFATWDPWKAALGSILFGGAASLQLRLQAAGLDVSQHLLGMLPYLLVMVVLVGATVRFRRKRTGIPAALGKPYSRQM